MALKEDIEDWNPRILGAWEYPLARMLTGIVAAAVVGDVDDVWIDVDGLMVDDDVACTPTRSTLGQVGGLLISLFP